MLNFGNSTQDALYMRMSTDKQENSIDSQRVELVKYAKSHKIEIVREYVDEGISGRKADKRPAFMQMIEDSEQREFDAVLIFDSSRFARNLEESLVYKSALKRNGVTIISATEPTIADDDASLLTDALLGAVNELCSRKLSKAVKRGMAYKAERGYFQSLPPLGYKRIFENGIPQIDEEQAALVRLIFTKFTTDTPTFGGVVKFLNANGFRTVTGRYWTLVSVKNVLCNITYIGCLPWSENNGEPYKGLHEPIIDKKVFDRAQEIFNSRLVNLSEDELARRRSGRDVGSYRHWLSGFIFCDFCGKVMGHCGHKIDKYRLFRCVGNSRRTCSPYNALRVNLAEEYIFEALELLSIGELKIEPNQLIKRNDNTVDIQISAIKKQLQQLNSRLERQRNAFDSGVDTLEEYSVRKTKTMSEIDSLKKKLEELTVELSDDNIAEKFKPVFQNKAEILKDILSTPDLSIAEKSVALRSLFHHATYNKETDDFTLFFVI